MELKFDLKAKTEEIVKKLQSDPAQLRSFESDPIKTVEKLLGIDLPDEQLKPLVTAVKAKMTTADIGSALDGLKKLF